MDEASSENHQSPDTKIPQPELRGFVKTIGSLVGKGRESKEYALKIKGEKRIVFLRYESESEEEEYASIQVREPNPIGKNYPYEELFCSLEGGRYLVFHNRGGLEKESDGTYNDPVRTLQRSYGSPEIRDANIDRVLKLADDMVSDKQIIGDPIDEFEEMQAILTQIKEQSSGGKIKTISRRIMSRRILKGKKSN